MHPQLLRGLQLKDLGRYADAERAFREALAQEPNDAFALHQLAACQLHQSERRADALRTIDNAISIEPNDADHHVLCAFILCQLERPKEALTAAQMALGLDPTNGNAFTAKAQAHLLMEKWPLAEAAARQALALDADNSSAANQLAQALRLQNKNAETERHLAGMLARDPEDAFTHANAGWAALQRNVHREAEGHFREALRLDPDFEYAREGLLTSFRARSPLYRAYLRYTFFMQRLSAGSRWAVILGLYFGAKLARHVPGGMAIVALYLIFVLWVWVAKGVGNFILLWDRFARHALHSYEKVEAVLVGGGVLLGVSLILAGTIMKSEPLFVAGCAVTASAFPLSMTLTNGSPAGRWVFGTIGFGTLALAPILAADSVLNFLPGELGSQLFGASLFGCLLCTWIGNIPALRKPL